MKLLFDQNLSSKLVSRLADLFPHSSHVQGVGLDCASDDQVWEYARLNGFAVVTKDEDYNDLSVLRGSPPKVVCCNVATARRRKWRLYFAIGSPMSSHSRRTPRLARSCCVERETAESAAATPSRR
jgi:predicted nuclease of predicted toxin-antitoxin system